jgi:hypothetical protein
MRKAILQWEDGVEVVGALLPHRTFHAIDAVIQ